METKEDIEATLANFTAAETQQFHHDLLNHDLIPTHAIGGIVAAMKTNRELTQQGDDTAAAAAGNQNAAIDAVDMTPEQLRKQAAEEIPTKKKSAKESIEAAQRLCGGKAGRHNWAFNNAIAALYADTDPPARGAAEAQRLVHKVLQHCVANVEKAVKKADRDIRDVVVLQCRASCTDPKDRDLFLDKAKEAYKGAGVELDKEVRAQLLLAYHKDPTNQRNGFISNNRVAADRRGGQRPRRRHRSQSGSRSRSPSRGRSPNRTHARRAARDEPPAAAARSPTRVGRITHVPPLCADAPGEPPSPMYVNPTHLKRSLSPGDSWARRPHTRVRLDDTQSVGPTLLLADNDAKVGQPNPREPRQPTGQQQQQLDTDLCQFQQPETWTWDNNGWSNYQAGATMADALQESYYRPTYHMYGASADDGSVGWYHPSASGPYQPWQQQHLRQARPKTAAARIYGRV